MSERQQFWPHTHAVGPAYLEYRSELAWILLERVGICTGISQREDSAGRAVLDIMPVADLVERAFDIADAFVNMAAARGELRPQTEAEVEQAYRRAGELERIKNDAEYPRSGKFKEEMMRHFNKEDGGGR